MTDSVIQTVVCYVNPSAIKTLFKVINGARFGTHHGKGYRMLRTPMLRANFLSLLVCCIATACLAQFKVEKAISRLCEELTGYR